MKIGVVGNCTARGIGDGFRQLTPDNEVVAFEASRAFRDNTLEEAASELWNCDVIFSHSIRETYGPLTAQALRQRGCQVVSIPQTAFTGFHPDCIYLTLDRKKNYQSPIGSYNSAIAAAAFSLKLGLRKTRELYSGHTFAMLGYFDEFAKARAFLLRSFQLYRLNLGPAFEEWMRHGSFMHTINHPKAIVLMTVAKLLAVQNSLIGEGTPTPDPSVDLLGRGPVWPVYPPVATRLGFPGDYLFRRSGHADSADKTFGLKAFLEQSCALYEGYPEELFAIPAVVRVAERISALL